MAEAKKTTKKKAETEPKVKVETEKIEEVEETKPQVTAKAGKRSAKAVKESEQKQAKQERKAVKADAAEPKKPAIKPTSNRMERAGKKYREAAKLIDKSKTYSLADALDLACKTSPTKFDGSIEMHINLNVDPRQADQNVRDTISLPAGTGKTVRITVLAESADIDKANKAGADSAGEDEIFAKLDKEDIDFDVLITTPVMMPKLGKYARFLGPRGLMPSPKSGTVTTDIAEAVKQAKAGRAEYRVDEAGIVHLAIGKASFGAEKLQQNADAVLASIKAARPSSLKGTYIKSMYLTTTMGPSIKLTI